MSIKGNFWELELVLYSILFKNEDPFIESNKRE